MNALRVTLVCGLSAVLMGCGGGGGGGADAPVPLSVVLSATSGTATVTEGATASTFSLTATVSGTARSAIIPDVSYDKAVFENVTVSSGATAGSYTLTAKTLPDLPGDTFNSAITFRLCQETACTNVYSGTTAVYTHNLTVKLKDWTMFQRNAAHTGYVHTVLDATKFAKAWSWTSPDKNYMSAVIPVNGSAFFAAAPYKYYSLDEQTGAQKWVYDASIGYELPNGGAPAYSNGTIYFPARVPSGTTFLGTATVRGFDAITGVSKSNSSFISQVEGYNSPTIVDDEMYVAQGYYGGVLYKYSLPSGAAVWTTPYSYSNVFSGQSPAVDDKYVYQSNGWGLLVHNRADGSVVADVSDPRRFSSGYSDLSAPVITSGGLILHINKDDGNKLTAVSKASLSVKWRGQQGIVLQPAYANGVIYAASMPKRTVDALNEADGVLQWSWSVPAGENLIENMIVCDNLLFVSTDKKVYAIDLKTHQTVWSYVAHGRMSLSSGYMLYVVANDYGIGGSVTVLKLR